MASLKSLKPKSTANVRVVKPAQERPVEEVRAGTGFHIGETLREARQQRGLDLEMVANELMIRRFYLEALEGGSFKDLPERVYASGFVRNYAAYLGMDGPQAVEQFKREAYGARGGNYQVELVMPEPIAHSIVPNRSAIIGAVAALIVMIAAIIFATRDKSASDVPSIPEPAAVETIEKSSADIPAPAMPDDVAAQQQAAAEPLFQQAPAIPAPPADVPSVEAIAEETPAPTPVVAAPEAIVDVPPPVAEVATAPSLPEPTATPELPQQTAQEVAAAADTRLVLEALESSWVEIKDAQGIVLFTNILKEGQLLPIPDQEGIALTTGNAGGLRLVLDGKALPPLGKNNEVKRSLMLDPGKLKQR
jgi:cytoskeleton protein RodZ